MLDFGKSLPIVHGIVEKETNKVIVRAWSARGRRSLARARRRHPLALPQAKIRAGLEEKEQAAGHEPLTELPHTSLKPLDVITRLQHKARPPTAWCVLSAVCRP